MASKLFASRYRLIRLIHGSGQSEVWVARDLDSENDTLVVIKILLGNSDLILREFFIRETEALTQIKHAGIVKLFDWGFDNVEKKYWISLEYLEGVTLEERIKKSNGLKDSGVQLIIDVIDAVAAAHAKGIIHRDLKPSNIMCEDTGDIKVLDFGICKIKTLLQQGTTVKGFGTPPYSAPEQIGQKDVDFRADIYSLGVIFFYMLTGEQPIITSVFEQVQANASIPEEYKKIIINMVQYEKEDRYPSVLHAKREIQKVYKKELKYKSTYYVKTTQNLCNGMVSLGLIDFNTESEAKMWLDNAFNDSLISIEQGRDAVNWVLYTHQYRINAVMDKDGRSLRLKSIHYTLSADMAKNKELSFECNNCWISIPGRAIVPKDSNIKLLLEEAENWRKQQDIKRNKELEHKRILAQWENVLKLQRKALLEKDFSLSYDSWDISQDHSKLEVMLVDEKEISNLYNEQPLLIDSSNGKKISVGSFAGLEGKKLSIALAREVNIDEIKEFGEISLDNRQVSSALKRQEDAIRAVRYGDSSNPKLLEIIDNPNVNNESKEVINVTEYIQNDLDEAKKEAIKATLRSDIYLIQGPPGTGKTKVISEIIVQLLKNDPSTKILLTSQSNAAVDNALEAVSKITGDLTLLRIGRKEKIVDRLINYQLDGTLNSWIQKTKNKSDSYLEDLYDLNRIDINILAEYKTILRQCFSKYDELYELDNELSKIKYRLFEEKNEEYINFELCCTLEKKIHEMDKEKDSYIQDLINDINKIMKFLRLPSNRMTYYNLEEIKSNLSVLEKEMERKLINLNHLEQVELIRQEWLSRLGKGREFEAICASEAQVVASTCLGVSNIPGVWSSEYDWVIVDEAGRATPPEILVPLVRGKRILLVGDHKQLPPVVDIDISQEERERLELPEGVLERSLFEDIFHKSNDEIKSILNIQYRMHTGIGRLVSQVFYDGSIENAEFTNSLDHSLKSWREKSVVWVSTSNSEERYEKSIGRSKQNQLEARIISSYCEQIEKELKLSNQKMSLGIISGYAEQKNLLEQLINSKDRNKWNNLTIDIDNIDAFQGQEREVVMYSVVRSNKRRDIGFLKDFRRLNVAFSRARKLLLVIGDHEMVLEANTYNDANPFAEVIRHIEKIDTDNCVLEVLPK
jgi:superfamily I DNA and/or RNA helicase